MVIISGNFIGDFKTGDNVNCNIATLELLYEYSTIGYSQRRYLRKPITIIIVSIIEAVLHDFHMRAKFFTREGVASLADQVIDHIRGRQQEDFEKYIASARKHDLLNSPNGGLYQTLDELRRLRNRVHIQNAGRDFEPDETLAFSEERKILGEQALEYTCKIMSANHARSPQVGGYVQDFRFPWSAYFPKADQLLEWR
jgi:hypothetical protein